MKQKALAKEAVDVINPSIEALFEQTNRREHPFDDFARNKANKLT